MLLTPQHLHNYQLKAINHQLSNPASMLWLDPGLGKTPVTLTSTSHLIKHGAVRAALVLAPLRVVQAVWSQEALKWSHLRHLRFSSITGTAAQRLRGLTKPADTYLMNYENLPWLLGMLQHYYINRGTLLPFDMLIVDESTKLKNIETKRMEAIIPILQYFKYRTGLTGTPASNGLEDLFGQYLVVDSGQRLGRDYAGFISAFFDKGGINGFRNVVTSEGEKFIHDQVSDITLEMAADDYIEMPDLLTHDVWVDLPRKLRRQYDQLELQAFLELDSGVSMDLTSPTSKPTKCLQFANGNIYTNTETKEWEPVHELKLDALEGIVEEAGGDPVLVAYNYKPDAQRIVERFPYAKILTGMKHSEFIQTLADWKEGKVRMLLGHPASMGHGVDGLQHRGHHLVWFGLNWSLELTIQFNMRLHRQGQTESGVICHRIMTVDTWDEVVRTMLSVKADTQTNLRQAVGGYRIMNVDTLDEVVCTMLSDKPDTETILRQAVVDYRATRGM